MAGNSDICIMENKNDANDAQKYFNPKEYATKIVGAEGEQTPELSSNDKLSSLIELLTDPANKEFREETLVTLKKEKAGKLLLDAIESKKGSKLRSQLLAACWESEINFSDQLLYFVGYACSDDYLTSLEAITVVQNMEGPFDPKQVKEALAKVKEVQRSVSSERLVLLNDLADFLRSINA